MTYAIFTTTLANTETEDAALYYETVSSGLGLAFLNEIEKRYEFISKNPFTYGYVDNKELIRDVQIGRFPYVIIYKIEAERVIILSVHNTHKKPR